MQPITLNRTTPPTHVRTALALGAMMLAPLAQAHHPMGGATPSTFVEGLLSGIGHPVIGIDHFAFLVVIALFSTMQQGSVRYLLPLAFVGATVGGTLYHLGAADLPLTETVIALSVLLGGLGVLFKRTLPALLLGGLFAVVGIYHGYAYGEAIVGAESTPLLAYLAGFALVQYAVIVGGIKLLELAARRSSSLQATATRVGGVATAAVGAVFLGMSLS
jgi:urease accessory protein